LNYLWQALKTAANSDVEAVYGPPRLGDVRDSLADISKAQSLLGYEPQFTVRGGLKVTWEWFKN
jgi:UDP-N-acetylglucosamine 4-epimerase